MADNIAAAATIIAKARETANALAQRYDELASCALVLDKPTAITITPAAARDVAKILRAHSQIQDELLKSLMRNAALAQAATKEAVLQCARAEKERALAVRAISLVDQVRGLGFFGMIGFWRMMKAGDDKR